MGIINSFLKRIGLKQDKPLLEAGNNTENTVTSRADELAAAAKEKFNNSLKVSSASNSQSTQEAYTHTHSVQQNDKPVLKVFSETGIDNQIEYIVKLQTQTGSLIPISVIKEGINDISIKDVVGKISELVATLQSISGKGNTTKKQHEIEEEMSFLNKKYKIEFTENMISMVENISIGNGINYQILESLLSKSVDISTLTPAQIMQHGKTLTQRLNVLDTIRTPEDAYKARSSLESFMRTQETQTAQSAIVTANLENLESGEQPLDIPTIVAFAKKIETITNEDGLLYSSYLKLEENRIISKLVKDISDYEQGLPDTPETLSIHQTARDLIEYLNSTKTITNDDSKENIATYMIDTLQGKGIESYLKNSLKYDVKLKAFLQQNPIEHQNEALNYVIAKMSCFGQVVDTLESESNGQKRKNLRSFIETTEYKDEDDSESKSFLYTIAQIERDYIKKNYTPIIHEFQRAMDVKGR